MEIYWDDNSTPPLPEALYKTLTAVINTGIRRAAPLAGEVSVTFAGPEEMRRLNREYRRKDSVTDVLSFPVPFPGTGALGDIVICAQAAREQAAEYGHSFEREMAFLVAHGLLHLLGYDHEDEITGARMFREQEEILGALGITR